MPPKLHPSLASLSPAWAKNLGVTINEWLKLSWQEKATLIAYVTEQEKEIIWAAGFFDGEGCFKLANKQREKPTLQVSIGQIDRKVLDRFKDAVGVGVVRGPYDESRKNPVYYYTANSGDAALILSKLEPYLSEVKREQGNSKLREAGVDKPDNTGFAPKNPEPGSEKYLQFAYSGRKNVDKQMLGKIKAEIDATRQ